MTWAKGIQKNIQSKIISAAETKISHEKTYNSLTPMVTRILTELASEIYGQNFILSKKYVINTHPYTSWTANPKKREIGSYTPNCLYIALERKYNEETFRFKVSVGEVKRSGEEFVPTDDTSEEALKSALLYLVKKYIESRG